MPRGGKREGSGPKPLSAQGKRVGFKWGSISLTWDETEVLDQAVQGASSAPLTWGSPEWNKAMRAQVMVLAKAGIHALPQYQAMHDNATHMAALNSREQVDE